MIVKIFVFLATATAVLGGNYIGPYIGTRVGIPTYGYGYAPNHYDQPISYGFGYEVQGDDGGAQQRHEEDDGYGNKKGSYSYVDPYGITRTVEYVADQYGFRANVKTNEPGTANQSPADVGVYSNKLPAHVIHKAYVGPQYDAPSFPLIKKAIGPAYSYNPVAVVKAPVPVYHSYH